MENKIVSFKTVVRKVDEFKKEGKKVVLCHGWFHFLHAGHIRYLKQAKSYGDIVIVSIRADKFIDGNETIQFDEELRAETLTSFDYVDMVFINPFSEIYDCIDHVRPDFFVKGFESKKNNDLDGRIPENKLTMLENLGVEFVELKEDDFTSTLRINRYLVNMPDNVQKYLQLFKQRYSIDDLLKTIEATRDLNVIVIGDTILDEYQYCSAIGKSSKDPTLVLKYESHDLFAGGVLAVANHTAGFAKRVDLVTILGEKDSHETFIRSQLKKNVHPHFLYRPNAPTLIKRRFVDGYSMNKLLEVYIIDDSDLDEKLDMNFYEHIQAKIPEYDLVIVGDFGHGTINANLKAMLSQKARFLAINAQSNAGNRGFNNITKYQRADYISMAEHEIRLEMRDLTGKIRPMMDKLVKKMGSRKITVTKGRKGCMVLDHEGGFVQVPSFTQKVVDRVGAGDALFALTSLVAAQNAPCELIGFLGNVVGALAVETMGNQKFIDSQTTTEYIDRLINFYCM